MMLKAFNNEQLHAVARLHQDPDFKILIKYLVDSVTELSLSSVRFAGSENVKISGACLGIEELRDQVITAPKILQQRLERMEAEALDPNRDPLSP